MYKGYGTYNIFFECYNCFHEFETSFPVGTDVYEDLSNPEEPRCTYNKEEEKEIVQCTQCHSIRIKKTRARY